MILDFFEGKLDGDSWEDICQACYRMMYREKHYTEIPAVQGGDGGIEGFTRNGIVNQCYCAEREYSENELYEHQRDKMTHDINKLLSPEYKKRLLKLGVPTIREWHFVVPFYKDSRIIEHAETKRQEVLKRKEEDPEQYDYIDSNFIIVIKQAEDFAVEITRIMRKSLTDTKLNLAVRAVEKPNWEDCDSEKVANISRKVKAVMGDVDDDDEDLNDRAIWAYTIALMQTSIEKKGNHPGVIIFDEPNQHSIIPEDMEEFFKSLLDLGNTTQIIVGITVKDTDTKSEIEKLPAELYHIIHIANKAFQRVK